MGNYSSYRVEFKDSGRLTISAYSRKNAIDRAVLTSFPYWKSHLTKTQKRKSITSCKKVN